MRIFISYRRSDAGGHAGRLRDRLRKRFGRGVFQDVDDIADGENFERALDRAIARSQVGLVVIGPLWLHVTDEQGRRRIDQPDDPVRTEVRKMLERDTMRVVPILVGGAQMPQEALLPDDIKSLAKRNARALRDSAWDADVTALIRQIQPFDPRPVGLTAAGLALACGVTIAVWPVQEGKEAAPDVRKQLADPGESAPAHESTSTSGNQPDLPATAPVTDGGRASRPAASPSATAAAAEASANTTSPTQLPPTAPETVRERRTSMATLGFAAGTTQAVENAYRGGTTQQHNGGYVHQAPIRFASQPMTAWTYFNAKGEAASVVAQLIQESRTRQGSYGNRRSGYEGDMFAFCTSAFASLRSHVGKVLGDPVSPVLSPQRQRMSNVESAAMVGGTGAYCDVPGNSCAMDGWKIATRADFQTTAGAVSLVMSARTAQNATQMGDRTDENTAGHCDIQLAGPF